MEDYDSAFKFSHIIWSSKILTSIVTNEHFDSYFLNQFLPNCFETKLCIQLLCLQSCLIA